jgi:hypothetical protein
MKINPDHFLTCFWEKKYTADHKLVVYPVIPAKISFRGHTTQWINFLIDTGSDYSFVLPWDMKIAEKKCGIEIIKNLLKSTKKIPTLLGYLPFKHLDDCTLIFRTLSNSMFPTSPTTLYFASQTSDDKTGDLLPYCILGKDVWLDFGISFCHINNRLFVTKDWKSFEETYKQLMPDQSRCLPFNSNVCEQNLPDTTPPTQSA